MFLQYKGDSGMSDLKCRRTSAHIFRICLVQNCLSQVKISETVYKSVLVLKRSVLKRPGKWLFSHPCTEDLWLRPEATECVALLVRCLTQKIVNITDLCLRCFVGRLSIVVSSSGLPDSTYNQKVDCWFLCVILYILLSGTPPFSEERTWGLNLMAQIFQANFQFHPSLFDTISAQG